MLDEKSYIFKVRYLCGKHGCRCGGHKREGGSALPGEICRSAMCAADIVRCRDGLAVEYDQTALTLFILT